MDEYFSFLSVGTRKYKRTQYDYDIGCLVHYDKVTNNSKFIEIEYSKTNSYSSDTYNEKIDLRVRINFNFKLCKILQSH
ncbi:MAG: hypothetical protein JWQ84_1888 [Mucilaginibacter sp.]|nr:hypothetical protein [Mucilaginibacter sp.]